MNKIIQVIYSASGTYKAEVHKHAKDGLYSYVINKWIEHDSEIQEIMNEIGFWGPLGRASSLSDTESRAVEQALEALRIQSGEHTVLNASKELKSPWHLVEDRISKEALETELLKEIGPEHLLRNKSLVAVARSLASDDVLFCEKGAEQYYLVHLTWARNNDDQYPKFLPFSTMTEFIEHCRETFQFDDD